MAISFSVRELLTSRVTDALEAEVHTAPSAAVLGRFLDLRRLQVGVTPPLFAFLNEVERTGGMESAFEDDGVVAVGAACGHVLLQSLHVHLLLAVRALGLGPLEHLASEGGF